MAKAQEKAPETENKSQAIREYKKAHAKAKPREIAAALVEQGFDVNAQYVSVVLSNARKKKGKKARGGAEGADAPRRGRPAGSGAATVGIGGLGLSELKLAKQLVSSAGGAKQARQAIDTIAALMN